MVKKPADDAIYLCHHLIRHPDLAMQAQFMSVRLCVTHVLCVKLHQHSHQTSNTAWKPRHFSTLRPR